MLDEEKIKLMTKITIYEKNEGLEDLILSKYYKEDYVQYGCLKTLVAATFCYWIIVAVYIVLSFEKVLADLNHIDYFGVISKLMVGYVITLAIFYIYAFIVYNYKYSKAKPGMVQYNKWLKKLVKSYESDETRDDIRSGKVKVYSGIGGFDEDFDFEDAPKSEVRKAEPAPMVEPVHDMLGDSVNSSVSAPLNDSFLDTMMQSDMNTNMGPNPGAARSTNMGSNVGSNRSSSVISNDELDSFLNEMPGAPNYQSNRNPSNGRIQMPPTVNRPAQNNGFTDVSED